MRQFYSPYAYSPNPVNSVDPDGKAANFLATGALNVGIGYTYSVVTNAPYTPKDAAFDFATGAAIVGLVSNSLKFAKLGVRLLKTELALGNAGKRATRVLLNQKSSIINSTKELASTVAVVETVNKGADVFAGELEHRAGLDFDLTSWLHPTELPSNDLDLGPAPQDNVKVDVKKP